MSKNFIIKVENGMVSARDLWVYINSNSKFSGWIKTQLNRCSAVEYTDYEKSWYKIDSSNNKLKVDFVKNTNYMVRNKYFIDYYITVDICKNICRILNNKKASEVLKYLLSIENKDIIIIEPPRKEIQFGDMLERVTGLNFIKQFTIPNESGGFYRVDFYLENKLIVEYDELRHSYCNTYYKDNDILREAYCKKYIKENLGHAVEVIRVKEGEEYEGLNTILKYLVKNNLF